MTEKEIVNEWLKSGASVKSGVRIFVGLRGDTAFGRIVKRNPEANAQLAVRALFRIAGANILGAAKPVETIKLLTIEATPAAPKFRERFPFLNNPTCPPELKILAADKITAYHNAVSAHARLLDCVSLDECFATAKTVVDNWIENDLIFEEFRYYAEMKKTLGKHPIFAEMKKMQALRRATGKDIFRKKKNLTDKINRIKYEIKRGDKPYLLTEREKRLREAEHLLNEVNRIIESL